MRIKALFLFGTRPEAIKLAPVVGHMKNRTDRFDVRVCVTAQHREMLDQVLAAFELVPDHDLNIMRPGQSLCSSTSKIIESLESVITEERPDIIFVQGDTTTTLCGALAGFYCGTPVGHIEAGLRTGDPGRPFPEEMNRLLTTRLSTLHFAPTPGAANNLRAESIPPERIHVTGNTSIDAVLHVVGALDSGKLEGGNGEIQLQNGKKLILVTAHRRESFGDGISGICEAIRLLSCRGDVQIVYPTHPNPNVFGPVQMLLGDCPSVTLTRPLPYVTFIDLMRRADLVLTDSGGIQEEAPAIGKPVLVMRDTTERPEGLETGLVRLVGTNPHAIVAAAEEFLNATPRRGIPIQHCIYGDGAASERISNATERYFEERVACRRVS